MSQQKGQPEEEEQGGAPDWMVTFSDCMTLLLTFFVLLLSFSTFGKKTLPKLGTSFAQFLPVKFFEQPGIVQTGGCPGWDKLNAPIDSFRRNIIAKFVDAKRIPRLPSEKHVDTARTHLIRRELATFDWHLGIKCHVRDLAAFLMQPRSFEVKIEHHNTHPYPREESCRVQQQ